MKILVIEDEHKIANSIKKGFEQESYACDTAFDGEEGFDLASSEEYDVLILDLMLPKMNGITILKKLRSDGIHTPILILTAKGLVENKIEGLNSGADDYLAKPFSFEELLARIRALSRRPKTVTDQELKVSGLALNPTTFEVKRAGKEVRLSKKEFALLEYLMRNQGKIVDKDKIISHVWNYEADILPNTVEVYIGYLRKKIDQSFRGKPKLIKTIRGFGYRLGK